jgi:hypothetical protein
VTVAAISRTYGTLSGSSPEALELWGRGRAAAGTAAAAVSDRAGALPRLQRSSAAQASALPVNWSTLPAQAFTSTGGPIACGGCTGLASSPATKNQVGRSGGLRCAA